MLPTCFKGLKGSECLRGTSELKVKKIGARNQRWATPDLDKQDS